MGIAYVATRVRAVENWFLLLNLPELMDKYASKRPAKSELPNLRRMHFRYDGTPKVKYGAKTAEKIAKERGMNAYRCPVCRAMHVGHFNS